MATAGDGSNSGSKHGMTKTRPARPLWGSQDLQVWPNPLIFKWVQLVQDLMSCWWTRNFYWFFTPSWPVASTEPQRCWWAAAEMDPHKGRARGDIQHIGRHTWTAFQAKLFTTVTHFSDTFWYLSLLNLVTESSRNPVEMGNHTPEIIPVGWEWPQKSFTEPIRSQERNKSLASRTSTAHPKAGFSLKLPSIKDL